MQLRPLKWAHIHERGLAGTRAAHEGGEAPRPEGSVDVPQQGQLRLGAALHLHQASELGRAGMLIAGPWVQACHALEQLLGWPVAWQRW